MSYLDIKPAENQMPKGWHRIKTLLLKEMGSVTCLHDAELCAGALFHVRLIATKVAREQIHLNGEPEECQGE